MADTESVGTKLDAVVAAGANGTVIALLKRLTTDIGGFVAGTATQRVEGEVAHGAAIASVNPVLIGISDGTNNIRAPGTSANGLQIQGQAVDNAAGSGFPVIVAGTGSGRIGGTVNPFTNSGMNADTLSLVGLHTTWTGAFNLVYDNALSQWQRLRNQESATAAGTSVGIMAAGLMVRTGTNTAAACQGLAQSIDNSGGGNQGIIAHGVLYNGTNFDRRRNNTTNTILASAGRTTTQQVTFTNYNFRGVHVVLDMNNVAAGPSVTLSIEAQDAVSSAWYTLLTGAAVTTVSTNVYKVYPGLTAAANAVANDVCPRLMRITVTANNANSGTYSVGLNGIV